MTRGMGVIIAGVCELQNRWVAGRVQEQAENFYQDRINDAFS